MYDHPMHALATQRTWAETSYGSWSVNANYSFTDERQKNSEMLYRDSYNLVNFAFGIARGSWHVDLFTDNATDELAELDNIDSYPLYDGNIQSATFFGVNRPRTIGLRFGQRF